MTDISCVVNCHRESYLVNPTLKSVIRACKTAADCGLTLEILVALDKSDSDTRDIVVRTATDDWMVEEFSFGDLALSRNAAVKKSSGRYIAFIDGDDMWCETWLIDSFMLAESRSEDLILHPEYNIYFGGHPHVLKHVDMESEEFEKEYILKQNYWTALSFSLKDIYERFPYRKNTIYDGFGYEDWTWNHETIQHGLLHKTVPGTAHFIRRGKREQSLLDQTNLNKAIPRIHNIYRTDQCTAALRDAT